MKSIIVIITLFSFGVFGQESLIKLPGANLEVKMGELTGAGTRYSIKALAGFVHPNGYIMKEECQKIVIAQSVDPKVSDVVKIQIGNEVIMANELTGFILSK